jgi:hypothetical protein
MEPRKPSVEELAAMPYRDWAMVAVSDNRTTRQSKVVGSFEAKLATMLKEYGLEVSDTEIEITGKSVAHAMRESKAARGAAVSIDDLLDLPRIIGNPKAVVYDKKGKSILYAFDPIGSDERLGKFVVKTGRHLRATGESRTLNEVLTAGLVPAYNLVEPRYALLKGSL